MRAKWPKVIAASVVLVVILGVGWLLNLFNAPEYRYIGYECQFDLIYNEEGAVDLALVGASRSVQGIGAPELARTIEWLNGEPVVVYNLAKSWRGQGINYTFMRDLLSQRKVRALMVEANLAEHDIYHAHWYRVAQYGDMLRAIWYGQANGPNLAVVFRMLRMVVDRFALRISQYADGSLHPLSRVETKRQAGTGGCMKNDEPIRPEALANRYADYKKYNFEGAVWSWNMTSDEQLHDTGFFKALKRLAERNDIPIQFYFVHERHYKRLDPNFAAIFKKKIGAPLAIPSDSLIDAMEKDGYSDPTHFNAVGRERYSEWLAKVIAPQLRNRGR